MLDKFSSQLQGLLRTSERSSHLAGARLDAVLSDLQGQLVDADVAMPVVTSVVSGVRSRMEKLPAGQKRGGALKQAIRDELLALLGPAARPPALVVNASPPQVVMLVGVQGAGKTTTAAKFAMYCRDRMRLKPALASIDLQRDAAQDQLRLLAQDAKVPFLEVKGRTPAKAAKEHLRRARATGCDTLIVDTAGRGAVEQALLAELRDATRAVKTAEIYLVLDSMTGQTALQTAAAFHKTVPLTGLVMTKVDSDSRGGAVLSARAVTRIGVCFLGTSESLSGLELFAPARLTGMLLGEGDIEGLAAGLERLDKKKAATVAKRMLAGEALNMNDMRTQFEQVLQMGGLQAVASKIPGLASHAQQLPAGLDERFLHRSLTLINSMTVQERLAPRLLQMPSRRRRIVRGAGCAPVDLSRLINQHGKMHRMMRKMRGKNGLAGLLGGMRGNP